MMPVNEKIIKALGLLQSVRRSRIRLRLSCGGLGKSDHVLFIKLLGCRHPGTVC